jgi:hypothetical protein
VVRALTTLVGLAGAAAILYFVTDLGDGGGSYWLFALLWAGAGFAVGLLYQAGGRRAPGLRTNIWMLLFAWLPWTLLSAAVIANRAGKPGWIADRARDAIPRAWLDRWEFSLPAFGVGVGLLLAFSLIEPRIGIRLPDPEPFVEPNPYAPDTPWQAPEERPFATSEQPAVGRGPRGVSDTEIQPPRRVQAQRQSQTEAPTEIQAPASEAETQVQPPPELPELPAPEQPIREIEPARREPPP